MAMMITMYPVLEGVCSRCGYVMRYTTKTGADVAEVECPKCSDEKGWTSG
jgi:hypothetical protein